MLLFIFEWHLYSFFRRLYFENQKLTIMKVKKRLLKPPEGHGDFLFCPLPGQVFKPLQGDETIGTCHQAGFFSPGVAARFMFVELGGAKRGKMIFMDTDRALVEARVPSREGNTKILTLLRGDDVLCFSPPLEKENVKSFFKNLTEAVKEVSPDDCEGVLENVNRFQNILLSNLKGLSLGEQLAESFLQFFNIQNDYILLSELTRGKEFREFFINIWKEAERFRRIYNEALDEYRMEFRFRYKNFPFPKLIGDEIPFWVVRNGRRFQLKTGEFSPDTIDRCLVFPKASPLTMFLRLYCMDVFIHGVGGGNYEWVNDRIIESFFHLKPPPCFVLSITYYIGGICERNFPYFFINPEVIRDSIRSFIKVPDMKDQNLP